jgi:UDP-2-acetamido-3-amino-2,3-dideoxy-glucuronate N-acetyltransferase
VRKGHPRRGAALMPIAANVRLGDRVAIAHPELVNLYGCTIGDDTSIGPFVEIQKDAIIGRLCKISSHSFICSGVTIGDEVFVGHGVLFINDRLPQATAEGRRAGEDDWEIEPTKVGDRAAIGSGAIILCGVTIGAGALIGAGAVVTSNVPAGETVAGVPARALLRARAS